MHILRATSDPQGHHERAHRTGGQAFLCFYDNKKDAQRPYDHFAGGIAPRSLLCVRKQTISVFTKYFVFAGRAHGPLVNINPRNIFKDVLRPNRYKQIQKISTDKQVQKIYRFEKMTSVIGLVLGHKEIR